MHDGRPITLSPLQTAEPQAHVIKDIITCEEILINRITARTPFIKTTDMQFILSTLRSAKRQLKKEDEIRYEGQNQKTGKWELVKLGTVLVRRWVGINQEDK